MKASSDIEMHTKSSYTFIGRHFLRDDKEELNNFIVIFIYRNFTQMHSNTIPASWFHRSIFFLFFSRPLDRPTETRILTLHVYIVPLLRSACLASVACRTPLGKVVCVNPALLVFSYVQSVHQQHWNTTLLCPYRFLRMIHVHSQNHVYVTSRVRHNISSSRHTTVVLWLQVNSHRMTIIFIFVTLRLNGEITWNSNHPWSQGNDKTEIGTSAFPLELSLSFCSASFEHGHYPS